MVSKNSSKQKLENEMEWLVPMPEDPRSCTLLVQTSASEAALKRIKTSPGAKRNLNNDAQSIF